jgi:hypothetical protein
VNQDGFPRVGRTPVLWQKRCLVIWSPKRGLPQRLSSRDLGDVLRIFAQVTWCWSRPEVTCDPGQAGFSASLMLVPPYWSGTEDVLYSPVVLRSYAEYSWDLGGVLRLLAQVTWCWRRLEGTCDPGQAGFSASLMLVLRDWNGTEVVFHSPVVLRSHGESSRDLGGGGLSADSAPKVTQCWCQLEAVLQFLSLAFSNTSTSLIIHILTTSLLLFCCC